MLEHPTYHQVLSIIEVCKELIRSGLSEIPPEFTPLLATQLSAREVLAVCGIEQGSFGRSPLLRGGRVELDLPVRGTQSDTQTREILANLVVPLLVRLPAEKLALAVSYAESGADGRIRTGDPLFTNQAAIEFSSKVWLSMYS